MTHATQLHPRPTSGWRIAPGGLTWALRHQAAPRVVASYLVAQGRPGGVEDGPR
ncbi:MAG TPA: hypothetical protein VGG38_18680 [Acidimicrobiales bacterium]